MASTLREFGIKLSDQLQLHFHDRPMVLNFTSTPIGADMMGPVLDYSETFHFEDLNKLFSVCNVMNSWLSKHPDNVVVLHCPVRSFV